MKEGLESGACFLLPESASLDFVVHVCTAAALMTDVYEEHKDVDEFLYITYR